MGEWWTIKKKISSGQGKLIGVNFIQMVIYIPINNTVSQKWADGATTGENLADVMNGRNLFMNSHTSHFEGKLQENKSE